MKNLKNYQERKSMITVLLSVYNGEEWLKECIESILDQTYRNFEFLIIDEGATDKSLSIIKKYHHIIKQFKLVLTRVCP